MTRETIEAIPPERYTAQGGFTQTGDIASEKRVTQPGAEVKTENGRFRAEDQAGFANASYEQRENGKKALRRVYEKELSGYSKEELERWRPYGRWEGWGRLRIQSQI